MQGTNIVNPWPDATDAGRVQANISPEVFNYFFRKLFVGERGPRQAMICIFFQRFHAACLAESIQPAWDETNEPRVNSILQRLNFLDVTAERTRAYDAGVNDERIRAESGRTASPSPEPKAQPKRKGHGRKTVSGTSPTDQDHSSVSADVVQ